MTDDNGKLTIIWEPESIQTQISVRTNEGRFCAHLLVMESGQVAFAIVDELQYNENQRVVFRKAFDTKPELDDLIAKVCEDIMDKDPVKAAAARSLADARDMLEAMLSRI